MRRVRRTFWLVCMWQFFLFVILPFWLITRVAGKTQWGRNYGWRMTAPRRKHYKWLRRQAQAKAVEDRAIAKDQWRIYKQFYAKRAKHPMWEWSSYDGNKKFDHLNIQWTQTMYGHHDSAISHMRSALTVNCKKNQKLLWFMAGQPYVLSMSRELGGYNG